MSLWGAAAIGGGAVIAAIVVALALLGRWLAIRNPTPLEREMAEHRAADPDDDDDVKAEEPGPVEDFAATLIAEHEAASRMANPAAPVVVQRARAKAKKKPLKKKSTAKPRRTPKNRPTRFDRINDRIDED